MSDDYTSDTQTTGTVTVGGSTTGDIETGGDQDWFAVTLEAGKTYRIDLEGAARGAHRGAGMSVDSPTYAALSRHIAQHAGLLALARECRAGQPIPEPH